MLQTKRQIITALVVAVFAAYANALLWGVFQFDDFNVIVGNSAVHSWPAWWADVGHGIRPLLKLSYTFDWGLGWGARGFHLSNLLIHAGARRMQDAQQQPIRQAREPAMQQNRRRLRRHA